MTAPKKGSINTDSDPVYSEPAMGRRGLEEKEKEKRNSRRSVIEERRVVKVLDLCGVRVVRARPHHGGRSGGRAALLLLGRRAHGSRHGHLLGLARRHGHRLPAGAVGELLGGEAATCVAERGGLRPLPLLVLLLLLMMMMMIMLRWY